MTKKDKTHINVSLPPLIRDKLDEIVELGYFNNISEAVRYAIQKMIFEFESEGKLIKEEKIGEVSED